MKRLLSLVMAVFMLLSVTACSNTTNQEVGAQNSVTEEQMLKTIKEEISKIQKDSSEKFTKEEILELIKQEIGKIDTNSSNGLTKSQVKKLLEDELKKATANTSSSQGLTKEQILELIKKELEDKNTPDDTPITPDTPSEPDTPSTPSFPSVPGNVDGMLAEVNPADYIGTKVVYATWKDPFQNEDGPVCTKFEQEYGIDFDWKMIDQGEYVNTIAALIAADQQPDIFYENGDFPGSLTVMQPLDAAKIDLTAAKWNKSMIKASTLGGHPYLLDTVANVFTELDLCVYNKNIFESNGLTTPKEYYEAGEWTFASFREAAKQVAALGKEYSGAGVLDETMLGAAGCTVFKYKDQKFSNGVDAHFEEVLTAMCQMRCDGYIKLDRFGFDDGKQGMCFTNAFGLKKTGYFTHLNPDAIGATYLPVWQKGDPQVHTGIYRGWGLVDGAKNPVGAGIFLNYYLDANNYDLTQTFHNQDVANFFFKLVSEYNDNVVYYRGPDMMKTTGLGERFGYIFMDCSPDQIKAYLDAKRPTIDLMIQKGNEIIDRELEWIKNAELAGMINKAN